AQELRAANAASSCACAGYLRGISAGRCAQEALASRVVAGVHERAGGSAHHHGEAASGAIPSACKRLAGTPWWRDTVYFAPCYGSWREIRTGHVECNMQRLLERGAQMALKRPARPAVPGSRYS